MVRVRRELRSLSHEAQRAFIGALKTLRATSDADGRRLYGERFRSYNYLAFKHAVAAVHPCADQGHLAANQLAFHRALLLEMERALLAVVARDAPEAGLEALPYWDWSVDLQNGESVLSGSLWGIWGSPYGDVDNHACARDPVFETRVTSRDTLEPGLLAIMRDHLGADADRLFNAFGLWRSPWSPASCPGLARNPGWAFNAPLPEAALFEQHCEAQASFAAFASCLQGRGYERGGFNFGPHNAPHILAGTQDDALYGAAEAVAAADAALLTLWGLAVALACAIGARPPRRLVLVTAAAAALLFVVGAEGFRRSVLGAAGVTVHKHLARGLLGHFPADFSGAEWRRGELACPPPDSCPPAAPAALCECRRSDARLSWLGRLLAAASDLLLPRAALAGTDFWDGAFSTNENYFFPIHGYVDLMHLSWARGRGEEELLRGWEGLRVANCSGTGPDDVLSEEMCFTAEDTGLPGAASGQARSRASSATPNQTCATLRDVMQASLDYTYDVLAEPFSWRAVEPSPRSCGPGSNASFVGSIVCRSNLNGTVAPAAACRADKRPSAPVKQCDPLSESLRVKAEARRQRSGSPTWPFARALALSLLLLLASPLAALHHLSTRQRSTPSYEQVAT